MTLPKNLEVARKAKLEPLNEIAAEIGIGELPVREGRASVEAGFVYPICGDMRTRPGLSDAPAAECIDIDENGDIVGLF